MSILHHAKNIALPVGIGLAGISGIAALSQLAPPTKIPVVDPRPRTVNIKKEDYSASVGFVGRKLTDDSDRMRLDLHTDTPLIGGRIRTSGRIVRNGPLEITAPYESAATRDYWQPLSILGSGPNERLDIPVRVSESATHYLDRLDHLADVHVEIEGTLYRRSDGKFYLQNVSIYRKGAKISEI